MKKIFFALFLLTAGYQLVASEQQQGFDIVQVSEDAVHIPGDIETMQKFIGLSKEAVHEKDTVAFGLNKNGLLYQNYKTEKIKMPLSVFVQVVQSHSTTLCDEINAAWQIALEANQKTIEGFKKEKEVFKRERQVLQAREEDLQHVNQQRYSGKTVLLSGMLGMGITAAAFKLGLFESASKATSSWW